MLGDTLNATADYDQVIESIQKNNHLLGGNSDFYKFNNRILLSNRSDFLNAVKMDIGGELIIDNAIGPFLYFGDDQQD